MNTRINTTDAEVVPISADITVDSDAVTEKTELRFVPVSAIQDDAMGLDAGLWTLSEAMGPGARLCFAWRFGRQAKFTTDVIIGIEGAKQAPDASSALSHRESLERAGSMALPGFSPCAAEEDHLRHQVLVLGPGVDPFELCTVTSPKLVTNDRYRTGLESVVFPKHGISRLNVQSAISALVNLDQRIDLRLTLCRFEVDSSMLRTLESADAAICSQLYRAAPSSLEAFKLELLRSRLGAWRATRAGIRLDTSLASVRRIDNHLVATVAGLLYGPGPITAEQEDATRDLRGCMPIDAVERPRLMPSPKLLADLMLSRPCKVAGSVQDGLILGRDAADQPVAIGPTDRARHMLILGATGVGKSTLMENMIAQDVAAGRGVILIDPHGDLYTQVRYALPREAAERAILADAGNFADPFGLNLLEITSEPAAVQRNFIANQLVGVFQSVLYHGVSEAFGPMFAAYFRNALFLLMDAEGNNASLADFDRVFAEAAYRRSLLERCADPQVVRFWKDIATKAGGEAALENIAPYICSKLTQFTGNPLLRPIVTALRTTLDIPGAMQRGETVLVNLAKGLIGEHDSALLGGLITIRIFCAAMARSAIPRNCRRPVRVYLDEFATYATGTLTQMLAECRKFGLELVLAGQSLDQVDGRANRPDVAHAILANVGSTIAFRVGPSDARRLADWFGASASADNLMNLPDHVAVSRLLKDSNPHTPERVWT